MSYTKFVTSVLFVCCLAGFYFAHSIVRANEPELYFYPEQKWSVKRLNPDDDNLPICAISNQLNNGYIVEMSGSASGFSAININFRQNAFQQGVKYEVQYLVPGISRITIPSKAVKQNTITSDLTGNLDFAKELSNAGVMDVHIRDNSFRLYLTGLKAKMSSYNECTTISQNHDVAVNSNDNESAEIPVPSDELLQTPVAAKEYVPSQPKTVAGVAPPPPAVPYKDENVAGNKIAMDSENNVRPDDSSKPRYIDILAAKLKKNSKNYQTDDDSNTVDNTNAADTSSAAEDTEAEAEVNDNNLDNADDAPVKTSNITRRNFKSPPMVKHVVKNEEPIVMDFTSKKDEEKVVEKTVEEKHALANDAAISLSQIEPASNSGPDMVADNNRDFVDMRNKISSLEQQVKTLTDKNIVLDEELRMALKDAETERLSVSSDNWNLERATMRFNEAERQIQRLGRQLQTQRAQCEMEKTELENMLFDPKLTSQQQLARLTSMETELDKAKAEMYRQQRHYEERIQLLEQQLKAQ